MLEHPRSAYAPEFRQLLLDRHVTRVLAIRDDFQGRIIDALAVRGLLTRRTNCEAEVALVHAEIGQEQAKTLQQEEQKLREAMGTLEAWVAGGRI